MRVRVFIHIRTKRDRSDTIRVGIGLSPASNGADFAFLPRSGEESRQVKNLAQAANSNAWDIAVSADLVKAPTPARVMSHCIEVLLVAG